MGSFLGRGGVCGWGGGLELGIRLGSSLVMEASREGGWSRFIASVSIFRGLR